MLRRKFSLLALALTLIVGATVGFWMPRDDDFFALRKNFEIFGAAYEELVTGYVEPLDAEHLMRTGLEAMLSELDPYTTFIDEADNADLSIITRGQYGGVGLNVGRRGGKITVISPIEGASGYKQGMRAGDIITHIEDQPTSDLSMSDVRNLLRGEPGTTVNVTVDREGEPDPLVFTLTREQVQLENVTYSGYTDATSGVGYVKLERFAREAGRDVQRAIQQLQQEGELRGLVLDLRDNPGGLLDAAVDVSELFVPRGSVIVSTRGRSPDSERIYRSEQAPIAPNLPLVVLVNGYSASASEIVAGAMQDLDRGVVMGTTTYGKGLVQVVKSLPYNTSLKMTTAKYYTPSGRSIQSIQYENGKGTATPDSVGRAFKTKAGRTVRDRHGIEPEVDIQAAAPSELEEALQRRAAFFFYANHFAAETERIDASFTVDNTTLADFQAWLDTQDFDYRTDGERSVTQLQEEFAAIGYQSVQDEIAALRSAVEDEKQAGFQRHAADLKHHLQEEILARFVSASEQIQAELGYDPQVQEAVSLLRNDDSYASILSVR
jgi:carboxyl-terminal processing protease